MTTMTAPFTPRPTLYKGIQMRSRLEAAWAEQFDAFGWAWQYEPQAFASELGQYLPDFLIIDCLGHKFYVEVKPSPWMDQQGLAELDRWRSIIASSSVEAPLIVATSSGDWACWLGAWPDPLWIPVEFHDGSKGVALVDVCLANDLIVACRDYQGPRHVPVPTVPRPVGSLYLSTFGDPEQIATSLRARVAEFED